MSLLPVIAAVDNFPSHPDAYPSFHPTTKEIYTPFHLTFADHLAGLPPVGLLRPNVLTELLSDDRDEKTCPWQFYREESAADDGDLVVRCVFFADWVLKDGRSGMSAVIKAVCEAWRDGGKFQAPLSGWRNETYMIYASPRSSVFPEPTSAPLTNIAFDCERSACAVFGFATYGVHLTAYEGEGADMKIWIPRRSATKPTWPSLLDNTVGGGIPSGMKPFDSLIKECDEEASFPEAFVRKHVKYTYDMKLPLQSDPEYRKPTPHDDEVESFSLLTIPQVLAALKNSEFKPNCGLILVNFLVRHGIITVENEPNYIEISQRSHRKLGVALPSGM
ncbi:hypothetical protein P7C73_g5786, partial [Tremellales sp. Uapishka_1]